MSTSCPLVNDGLDPLSPSQQFSSHVWTGIPELNSTKQRLTCLVQGQNAVPLVKLEPLEVCVFQRPVLLTRIWILIRTCFSSSGTFNLKHFCSKQCQGSYRQV